LDRPDGLSTSLLSRMAETMGTDAFAAVSVSHGVVAGAGDRRRLVGLPMGKLADGGRAVELDVDRTSAVRRRGGGG
jgi:hypothetical protein